MVGRAGFQLLRHGVLRCAITGLAGAIGHAKKTCTRLSRTVGFLICPWVKVQNLASHVLAQAISRLRAHWQERYGFEPVLLETFVDRAAFGKFLSGRQLAVSGKNFWTGTTGSQENIFAERKRCVCV